MNKLKYIITISVYIIACEGSEPFKPVSGSINYMVYFPSRYRGICVGALLSRTAVITAAVCVVHPTSPIPDIRSINVVTGTSYRHPKRGIRVQVSKILLPKIPENTAERGYFIQKSPAILLLLKKVPDQIAEVPLRPIGIDYSEEEVLNLHEECIIPGWHFFYKGDKIYPEHKFHLPRNLRVQFVKIAKKNLWCSTISLTFKKALNNMGYSGTYDKRESLCIRDPDQSAQPCHGMYGGPLICRGKIVALMTAPDAQWVNCTGFSNIVHLVNADHLKGFMSCVSPLFGPAPTINWEDMKKSLHNELDEDFDYLPAIYDKLLSGSDSSDDD